MPEESARNERPKKRFLSDIPEGVQNVSDQYRAKMRVLENVGYIMPGWDVVYVEERRGYEFRFTTIVPPSISAFYIDEPMVLNEREFGIFEGARVLGLQHEKILGQIPHPARLESVAGHNGHDWHAPRLQVGDSEEETLNRAILGGHTLVSHLSIAPAGPQLQIGLHEVRLITADGVFGPVGQEHVDKLTDLLNIRAETRADAIALGLLCGHGNPVSEYEDDEEEETGAPEGFVYEMLKDFVQRGWIDAWSDQPDNGAGAIVLWKAKEGSALDVNEDGQLNDREEGTLLCVHMWGYEDVHPAIQAYKSGRLAGEAAKEEK